MVGDLVEVGVVGDAAVGGYVAVGYGGPLVFEAQVEGFDVVADGGGYPVDAVDIGEVLAGICKVLAAFHVDVGQECRTSCGEVVEFFGGTKVLDIAEEEVGAVFLSVGDIEE